MTKGEQKVTCAHLFSSSDFFPLAFSKSVCLSLLQKVSGNWVGILSGDWTEGLQRWGILEGEKLNVAS